MSFLHLDIVGELLSEAWRDYKNCYSKLVTLAFLCSIPSLAVALLLLYKVGSYQIFGSIALIFLAIISYMASTTLKAALMKLLDYARKGQSEGNWLKQCLAVGWKTFFNVLVIYTLIVVAAFLPLVVSIAIAKILSAATGKSLGLIAIFIMGVPLIGLMIWLSVRLMLAIPSCLFEGWGPIRAIVRSFVMTSGNFWILLLAVLPPLILITALSVVISYFMGNVGRIPAIVIGIIIGPFITAVVYRAYLRLSGEGL